VTDPLRTCLALAGLELKRWVRQPIAVATALLLPVAMAGLVSAALGRAAPELTLKFAVVDLDAGPAGVAFVDQALGHPAVKDLIDVRQVDSRHAARALLDDDVVDVVVVLPPRLSEDLASVGGVDIDVWGSNPIAGDLAHMIVDQYGIRAQASAVAIARTGAPPDTPWPLEVDVTAPGGQPLDAARHYGPSTGMFFLLVTLGFAAQRFVADRRRGLADRLAAAPVAAAPVLVGRVLAALLIGGLSMATTALSMQFLFGRSWGAAGPVVLLIAAVVIAMGGVAAVVAALSRTPEQAQMLAMGIAFVFALASGSFSPPGAIGTRPALADLVPTSHALDAFALLSTEHAGIAAITGPIGVLLAFGLAGFVLATFTSRRFAS
jgi:ABC-2 type transport system permease protein